MACPHRSQCHAFLHDTGGLFPAVRAVQWHHASFVMMLCLWCRRHGRWFLPAGQGRVVGSAPGRGVVTPWICPGGSRAVARAQERTAPCCISRPQRFGPIGPGRWKRSQARDWWVSSLLWSSGGRPREWGTSSAVFFVRVFTCTSWFLVGSRLIEFRSSRAFAVSGQGVKKCNG